MKKIYERSKVERDLGLKKNVSSFFNFLMLNIGKKNRNQSHTPFIACMGTIDFIIEDPKQKKKP